MRRLFDDNWGYTVYWVFGLKVVQAMIVPTPYQALWKLFNLLGVVVSEFCQGLIPISSVQHNTQETHRDAGESAESVTVLDLTYRRKT